MYTRHNIIRTHKPCFVGLTVFCIVFLILNLNVGIFCKILSVAANIVMDLNDVLMLVISLHEDFGEGIGSLIPHLFSPYI